MQLPEGYSTESHWSWSLSDPSFWSEDSSTWPWEDLDDTFLFPMMTPSSLPNGWRRQGSTAGLPIADSDLFAENFDSKAGEENDGGKMSERSSPTESSSSFSSSTSSSIPITATGRPKRGREPQQTSDRGQFREAERKQEGDIDIGFNTRRMRQRQPLARIESFRNAEWSVSNDNDDCECSECKARKRRRSGAKPMTIQTRLNAISF